MALLQPRASARLVPEGRQVVATGVNRFAPMATTCHHFVARKPSFRKLFPRLRSYDLTRLQSHHPEPQPTGSSKRLLSQSRRKHADQFTQLVTTTPTVFKKTD